MNTSRTLHVDPARITRYAEGGLYTALAGILLTRALFHSGPITFGDSLLIMLGAVFGLMASCAANPACALWGRLRERTGEAFTSAGDVLAFNRRESIDGHGETGDTRRAA